ELAAVEMGEPRRYGLAILGREDHGDGPVLLGPEGLDLGFALADKAQRHRLDASGRTTAGQFAPEYGRKRKAHEVIQGAASEVGLDQLAIDFAGVLHGIQNRGSSNLIEDNALNRLAIERLAALEFLADMP